MSKQWKDLPSGQRYTRGGGAGRSPGGAGVRPGPSFLASLLGLPASPNVQVNRKNGKRPPARGGGFFSTSKDTKGPRRGKHWWA